MFYPSTKEHVLMFSCLILASNPHVLLFSCLTPRKQSPCSHVLLSSPKNMFSCLITMHIFLIPIKMAQLHKSVAYFCSIGLYFLV